MAAGAGGKNPHTNAPSDEKAIPASAAHLFRKKGRRLLFDAATRVTFELDRAGEAAARSVTASGKRMPPSLRQGADSTRRRRALRYLRHLQDEWYFGDFTPRAVPLNPNRPYTVIPLVSARCNLRCRYCFQGSSRAAVMSRPIMEATAAFLARLASEGRISGYVAMGPGGEPTVALSRYEDLFDLLAEQGAQYGVSFFPVLSVTNLTTLHRPSVKKRLQGMQVGTVSLDGPPEAHDALRVHRDGTGTYADVRQGLEIVRESGANPAAIATLTALFPDVSEVYFHLFELGFPEVAIKPVRAHPRQPFAIGQDLDAICAGYERFVDRLLALPDDELLQRLLAFTGSLGFDYFGRFLVKVIERDVTQYRCRAGIESVIVDAEGQLHSCPSLIGVPQAHLGSVWDGIDEARVRELADRVHVSRRAPCNVCWARLVCGGGCMHQSYLTYGELWPPDPAECRLNRHLVELAIWLYAELQETRPGVVVALPNISRDRWRNAPPVPCGRLAARGGALREWSALRRAEPSTIIDPKALLRRRLLRAGDDRRLGIRLGWDATSLYLLVTPEGADPERLRGQLRAAYVHLFIPTEMVGKTAGTVPTFPEDFRWTLVADLAAGHITYDNAPRNDVVGQVLSGGLVATGPYGCFMRIPWSEVSVPAPNPGVEFGLRLVLDDVHGGQMESAPHHDGNRVQLVVRRSKRWREALAAEVGEPPRVLASSKSDPSVRAVWSPKTPRL